MKKKTKEWATKSVARLCRALPLSAPSASHPFPTVHISIPVCVDEFCYDCIFRWTNVVASKHAAAPSSVKCPICKGENFSVLTEFDGTTFQRHYIDKNAVDSFVFTKAHRYRLQCYYTEPGFLDGLFNVSRYWKSRKYLQSNAWLSTWLKREIQALVQEEDVDIIVRHIRGVVDSFFARIYKSYPIKNPETIQEEFKAAVQDAANLFLHARTCRFVDELELFLASGLNIAAYDAAYMNHLGQNHPSETIEPATDHNVDRPLIPYLYIFDAASDDDIE